MYWQTDFSDCRSLTTLMTTDSPLPTASSAKGMDVFSEVPNFLGNWLMGDKTDLARKIVLLGLQWSFQGPDSGVLLYVALPDTKKDNCRNRILGISQIRIDCA